MAQVTIFFDGACPLCLREIALLRRLDAPRGRLRFEDVSSPDAAASCPVSRETLLARFHVQKRKGELVAGAEAFTEAWGQIRGLGWVRPIGRFPPSRWVLNGLYGVFLKIRPRLQLWAQKP